MNKNNFWLLLSLQIVLVFAVVMAASIVPDTFPKFFGDIYCTIPNHFHMGFVHDTPEFHWGYRHFIWMVMGLSLFTAQVVRIVIYCDKQTK